ncbi:hypothetical protein XELAEV_18003603mg [Xenopus laevis]|uniref:G-protein coupled receptors family 1 profile domain-containing protein n=1 Tax=Xenopus laevis TaxID=8355 RepID=A0A974BPU4_XENLA|nr:hypothetical protein XELAEV_18003603mg [Xenopus laevis]
MFFIYRAIILKAAMLLTMVLDRYLATCHYIMKIHLIFHLFFIGLVESSLFSSPVIIVAFQVQFCRSNIFWNFACENMVLLNLGAGNFSKIQPIEPMTRTLLTAIEIGVLLVSYLYIFHSTMKIIRGKAPHKTLHSCSTHLIVVTVNENCSNSCSIIYWKSVSLYGQNLFSAIFYSYRMKKIGCA